MPTTVCLKLIFVDDLLIPIYQYQYIILVQDLRVSIWKSLFTLFHYTIFVTWVIVSLTMFWGICSQVTPMTNKFIISVTLWQLAFKCPYDYLGRSMLNSVTRCMPLLRDGLKVKCTQVTLDISTLKYVFLFTYWNVSTWHFPFSMLNRIFPLHTKKHNYYLKFPDVLC